ncbi:adenylate kinase family protein [Mycoplasma miroungirhinis]|uniref:Adenylate kinase n=1 Tax=Mycoplasma miroungirhinis TaxID=754516 RepID=A0A6M4JCB5_9MOLU|nr:nucleoside monophosphate kinase [Mycoplasma miroungirhinis]QJR43985.1 nucleoside monophosphate kinase [Mycoplasma miroungirhinis]
MIKTYKDLNLIFLGAPGAGKGTIANWLVVNDQFIQVSTGEILREEIKNQTKLGLEAQAIMARGDYVSDDIVNEIIKNKLQQLTSNNKHFILDGYPRTLAQVDFLESLNFTKIDYVILLNVDKNIILERLTNRRICPNCGSTYHLISQKPQIENTCDKCNHNLIQRKDDQPEVILKRLDVFNKQTKPLINTYLGKGNLIEINANQNAENVYLEIKNKLINLTNNK